MSNTSLLGSYGAQAGDALMFRNRIINGDMRIDQRGSATTAITVNSVNMVYATDRWGGRGKASAGVFTLGQSSIAPPGFSNSLVATVTTAATPAAGDVYFIQQRIEGFNIADLAQGSASASSFTLSFWVRSSVTGTHGGSVGNNVDRSLPFSFTINAANTWEYKTITVSGCPDGTWNTTNGMGLLVHFSMGTTLKGAANAWGNYNYASTGSVDLISTNGATFYITGVQLEAGPVATPFERRPIGTELALCQRYAIVYGGDTTIECLGYGFANATTFGEISIALPVKMRIVPAGTLSGNWQFSDGVAAVAITSLTELGSQKSTSIYQARFNVASVLTLYRPYRVEAASSSASRFTLNSEL